MRRGCPATRGWCQWGATASQGPRYRALSIAALPLILLALCAQPAKAEPVTVTGQDTLADYEGELQAQVMLRITDRNNSPLPPIFPDDQPGSMQDTALSVTVPCTATPDTTIGSHCGVSTTADAVAPGVVVEGDRAVWAFDQVRLLDGGLDGDADTAPDNMLFATQGVFVP